MYDPSPQRGATLSVPRVVVIGAGVVGCAVADELTERGWTDLTLLDRGSLFETGGSTTHAPGLVSRTSPSRMMQAFAAQTIAKFAALEHPDGPCLIDIGTLEVALTEERLAELHRRHGFTTSWGFAGRMLTADECVADYPILDPGLRLWDLLWAAGQDHGIAACGRSALAALRIEKGYRAWGTDMTAEHTPEAAGLGFAVDLGKPDFIGREALLRGEEQPRGLACLRLDDPSAGPSGGEPVFTDDTAVGYVTSAAYGATVDAVLALAWVDRAQAGEGTTLAVGYFGRRVPATVVRDPVVDPDGARVRS